MQALIEKVRTELRGVWRFRRYGLIAAWSFCLFGWLVVYALPETYQSQARVNVDTRTALRSAVQGMVVEQDLETQLNRLRQSLLGSATLAPVAREVGLITAADSPAEADAKLAKLRSMIEVALEPPATRDPRIPNTFYRITYRDGDRERAIKVVDVLLSSFVGSATRGRSGTENAERFLRAQIEEVDKRLAEAEGKLAEFKKKNVGLVPGEEGDYFARLQTEMREIQRLETALSVANGRRAELQRQLRGETPFVPTDTAGLSASRGAQPGAQDTSARIQETQARLDDMLLRFTDRHPDVVATRETLEQLKVRQKEELEALKRGDAGAAALAGAASNPVYQNIQLQLNQADVEIATLRSQLQDHRRAESELKRAVDTVPEVEAEYARLTRDYDVTKAQYNALLERLERAKLSGDAEQTGVVDFEIVDPPSASFKPIFPNRPLFLAAVFVLGVGAGVGVAYLMHMMRPVFASSRSLADLTGLTVLGSVSRTWVDSYKREMRTALLRYSAASVLLFVMFIVAVAIQQPASRFIQELIG